MSRRPISFDKKKFIEITQSSPTMMRAAAQLDIHYGTFIRYAKRFGIYRPNQGAKGTRKSSPIPGTIPLKEILEGKHPTYSRGALKRRILRDGIKENKCERCGNTGMWFGSPLTLQLHHKDGNSRNHKLDNLELLCPNCHTQTDTWCSKGNNNTHAIFSV